MTTAAPPVPKPMIPPDPPLLLFRPETHPPLTRISPSKPKPHPPPLALYSFQPPSVASPPPYTFVSPAPLSFPPIFSSILAHPQTIFVDLYLGSPHQFMLSHCDDLKIASAQPLLNHPLLRRRMLFPELEMPRLKPTPPDPPDPPDRTLLAELLNPKSLFTPPFTLPRTLLAELLNQSLCFLVLVDRVPLLPIFGLKPWSFLLPIDSVASGKVFSTCWTSEKLINLSLGFNSYYFSVQSLALLIFDIIWISSGPAFEPFSAIFIVHVRPITALCRFIIASMRSLTAVCRLCSILFMDSCVLCLASSSWWLFEGLLPANSSAPANLVPLDNFCLSFPNVSLSVWGLEVQDTPVLQGSSSRFIVSPAFVVGFFSAFVAYISSVFCIESNALLSVSVAADQNVHGFLVLD